MIFTHCVFCHQALEIIDKVLDSDDNPTNLVLECKPCLQNKIRFRLHIGTSERYTIHTSEIDKITVHFFEPHVHGYAIVFPYQSLSKHIKVDLSPQDWDWSSSESFFRQAKTIMAFS